MKDIKAVDIATYAIVFLVMAASCFVYFSPRFGLRLQSIRSGSMAPALRPGELIVVNRIDPREVKPGDIIVYRPAVVGAEFQVAHRVVKINTPVLSFVTKGDALPDVDPEPVPAGNVLGRVGFHVPVLGYVVAFLQTTPGFLVGLVLPGLFVVGIIVSDLWKEARKKKDETEGEPADEPEAATQNEDGGDAGSDGAKPDQE